jgi:hypothetical protein
MSFNFGRSAAYGLLAQSGITNAGGSSAVSGGVVGTSGASIIGWNPPPVTVNNADAAGAILDGQALFLQLSALPFTSLGSAVNMSTSGVGGTATYVAGNYSSTSSLDIPTSITLDGQGNPNAVFVFLSTASTIVLESGASVNLINGTQARNVYWVVGSSFTSVFNGISSVMQGNILAYASVALGGGVLNGRALAVGGGAGAITIAASESITVPSELNPAPAGLFNVSGLALPDIQIQCVPVHFNAASPSIIYIQSDAAGNWAVQLAPGSYYLTGTDAAPDVYWYHHRANVIVTTADISNVNLTASL